MTTEFHQMCTESVMAMLNSTRREYVWAHAAFHCDVCDEYLMATTDTEAVAYALAHCIHNGQDECYSYTYIAEIDLDGCTLGGRLQDHPMLGYVMHQFSEMPWVAW